MTREELIKKIALKMDEISSSDDVIVAVDSSDNNPLYAQINGLLNESINDVLTKAPIFRIKDFVDLASSMQIAEGYTFDKSRKVAHISVPDDFIRIVSIVDDAFQRPIVDLAIDGDDVSKRQHNKFLVAKTAKPVAVLGRDDAGDRVITCYSYKLTDTPAPSMSYIKRFEGSKDLLSTIHIDAYLEDIITWVCAGRVFAAQGDLNKGKICDDNAAALMI